MILLAGNRSNIAYLKNSKRQTDKLFNMDEYNSGWDPEVKKYFRKIMNSLSVGLLWLLSTITLGLFFDLATARQGIKWYTVIFYLLAAVSFFFLIRYYYRVWSKKEK